MASVTIKLDRDLEARVSKYADGCGVPLEKLVERALKFALRSRYPSNELPDAGGPVDPGFGQGKPPTDPGYDKPSGARPDQGLPGSGGRPDQDLPGRPARPDQGLPGSGARPDQGLPGGDAGTKPGSPVNGRCPIFDPSVDNELPDSEIPPEVDNELPETAEPKA